MKVFLLVCVALAAASALVIEERYPCPENHVWCRFRCEPEGKSCFEGVYEVEAEAQELELEERAPACDAGHRHCHAACAPRGHPQCWNY